MTITDLKPGESAVIDEFEAYMPPIKLLELGCLPGSSVVIIQEAPLNDPIYINVNGTHIAIRRTVASQIKVVPEKTS
ncbi:MAG: ferrous iron transport protein A [Eudoraea sp.]|nr:ferrous iron transport protein A [Eudoraea sp.]